MYCLSLKVVPWCRTAWYSGIAGAVTGKFTGQGTVCIRIFVCQCMCVCFCYGIANGRDKSQEASERLILVRHSDYPCVWARCCDMQTCVRALVSIPRWTNRSTNNWPTWRYTLVHVHMYMDAPVETSGAFFWNYINFICDTLILYNIYFSITKIKNVRGDLSDVSANLTTLFETRCDRLLMCRESWTMLRRTE